MNYKGESIHGSFDATNIANSGMRATKDILIKKQ